MAQARFSRVRSTVAEARAYAHGVLRLGGGASESRPLDARSVGFGTGVIAAEPGSCEALVFWHQKRA